MLPAIAEPLRPNPKLHFTHAEKEFMLQNEKTDVASLLLKSKWNVRQKELLGQVALRQKITTKLPTLHKHPDIYFPPLISLEQSSSEQTAKFKSTLQSGKLFIDLSAGMGIDSYYLSAVFKKGILVEPNVSLAHITAHNLYLLGRSTHLLIAAGKSAMDFLNEYPGTADLIYIDPSRRNEKEKKVFRLEDCEPDVISLLPKMLKVSNHILIKTSPLLDITLASKSLKNVKNVYVISTNRECKELLFEIEKTYSRDYAIHAVNLDKEFSLSFFVAEEKSLEAEYSLPENYLYEPDSSILKAGAFNILQKKYPVKKIHPQSHLYTSKNWIREFPGRQFEISKILKPSKKEILKNISENKANITIRNYPGSVAELRQKWKLTEGGKDYLFATTLCNEEKRIILCKRLKP